MFTVTYQLSGTESEARKAADLICVEQTVEAPDAILTEVVRKEIVGRIERFGRVGADCFEAVISYPPVLLEDSIAQLLAVIYGISSLRRRIRVVDFDLPEDVLRRFAGPRFGIEGVRRLSGVQSRPLVCAVLKPVGLTADALADLAKQFVFGGVDLIKDDQGLVNQPFAPFEERVQRCTEAIRRAARERGRPCLYVAHVTAAPGVIGARAAFARSAGAGGLLVCPGLTGFDAITRLALDISLPIFSHPSLLGSYATDPSSGLAPWIVYGRLPRLAGADVSIYPSVSRGFPISADDCHRIADAVREPLGELKPMVPTAAGRIGANDVADMQALYGRDVLFILGSAVQQDADGVAAGCEKFMRKLR